MLVRVLKSPYSPKRSKLFSHKLWLILFLHMGAALLDSIWVSPQISHGNISIIFTLHFLQACAFSYLVLALSLFCFLFFLGNISHAMFCFIIILRMSIWYQALLLQVKLIYALWYPTPPLPCQYCVLWPLMLIVSWKSTSYRIVVITLIICKIV